MKVTGIIAEYNPFHTGHSYQITEAKKRSGADYIVVAMSGDFVQRGEPAIFDKYTRTQMALSAGADLVLEIPVCYASGSAEYFAEGGVSLLLGTGVIDTLCFGSETPDPELFKTTASLLIREPESYRTILKRELALGKTFPHARMNALLEHFRTNPEEIAVTPAELSAFLNSPNNILGIEYCKAIQKNNASMEILPILREGNGYHSSDLKGAYASASAIRKELLYGPENSENSSTVYQPPIGNLCSYIPPSCHSLFQEAAKYPLCAEDFTEYLILMLLTIDTFDRYLDISPELSDRIQNLRYTFPGKTWSELIASLKTRQLTESHIRRALIHLLLGTTKEDTEHLRTTNPTPYLRVLGFRKEAAPLLHAIKQNSPLPLITKNAAAHSMLERDAQKLLTADFQASHLYRSIQARKYRIPFKPEYQYSPIRI